MPENNQSLPPDNSLYFFHATRVSVSASMLLLRCAISLFLSNTQTAVVILSMWFQHIPIRRILFKELSASEREQFNHRSLSINIGVAFYYEFLIQLVKLTDVKAPRMSFYVLAIASALWVTWISIHFE